MKKLLNVFKSSYRYRIISISLILTLIPTLLSGSYMYSLIKKNLSESVGKDIDISLEKTNQNIDNYLNILDTAILLIGSNKMITSRLSDMNAISNDYTKVIKRVSINSELNKCSLINFGSINAKENRFIESVYLFKDKSTFFNTSYKSKAVYDMDPAEFHTNLYLNFIKKDILYEFIPPSENHIGYFIYSLRDFGTGGNVWALVFALNFQVIEDEFESLALSKQGIWFISDNKGNGLISNQYYHNDIIDISKIPNFDNIPYQMTIKNTVYRMTTKKVGNLGLNCTTGLPINILYHSLKKGIWSYLFFIIIICIFTTSISFIVIYRLTMPLKEIRDKIALVGEGNFSTKLPKFKYREFDMLSDVFNNMTHEIDYLIKDVYQKQLLIKNAELNFLQSQMNPHFMFNVLNTIAWQAKIDNNTTLHKMISSFSQLLQATIYHKPTDKIPLKEELKYIEFYLYLQTYRFGDKIDYSICIEDDSLLSYFIPKLTIQPIVENAIVHGLEPKAGKGIVTLNIFTEDNIIYFEIIDDGVGFNCSHFYNFSESDCCYSKGDHNHVGLITSHKIIQKMYGQNYGITITSELDKGTNVLITMPYLKEEDDA